MFNQCPSRCVQHGCLHSTIMMWAATHATTSEWVKDDGVAREAEEAYATFVRPCIEASEPGHM